MNRLRWMETVIWSTSIILCFSGLVLDFGMLEPSEYDSSRAFAWFHQSLLYRLYCIESHRTHGPVLGLQAYHHFSGHWTSEAHTRNNKAASSPKASMSWKIKNLQQQNCLSNILDRKFGFVQFFLSFEGAIEQWTSKSALGSNFTPDTPILRSM